MYWERYVDGDGNIIYGECHRFPPAFQRVPNPKYKDMFPTVFDWAKNWPRTDADDWCGEHTP